jgi:hypothetical protein
MGQFKDYCRTLCRFGDFDSGFFFKMRHMKRSQQKLPAAIIHIVQESNMKEQLKFVNNK